MLEFDAENSLPSIRSRTVTLHFDDKKRKTMSTKISKYHKTVELARLTFGAAIMMKELLSTHAKLQENNFINRSKALGCIRREFCKAIMKK